MESHILLQVWTRTIGHVLWTHQLSHNLSINNEWYISSRTHSRMVTGLYQQYSSIKWRRLRRSHTEGHKCAWEARATWSLRQTWEKWILCRKCEIQGGKRKARHGAAKGVWNSQLAPTRNSYPSQKLFMFLQFLSMEVEQRTTSCIRKPQNNLHLSTSTHNFPLLETFHRCFSIRNRSGSPSRRL